MLVGEPPYIGNTAQAVLGKIIAGAPVSATQIRKSVPGNVDAAIRKALEKLPADRFTGAQEFAKALGDAGFRHGELALAGVAGGGPWNRVSVGFAGTTALFVLAFGWVLLRPAPPAPVERFELTLVEDLSPSISGVEFALSADGLRIVYVSVAADGRTQLWQRALSGLEPIPIPGTEGAISPVLSPDGQSVAFADTRVINTVSLSGGPPFTVVAGDGLGDHAWGSDGMIYFSRDTVYYRVPATGGEPEVVTSPPSGGASRRSPDALPNGRGLLLTVVTGDPAQSRIAVVGPEGAADGSIGCLLGGFEADVLPSKRDD